jgi:IS5 family transposase
VPRSSTADRSYGEPAADGDLEAAGVCTVAVTEQSQGLVRRRDAEHAQGSAGQISYLKRRYGWDRTRLDGRGGTAIWCAHGDFAHNLVKISALASRLGRASSACPAAPPDQTQPYDFLRSK